MGLENVFSKTPWIWGHCALEHLLKNRTFWNWCSTLWTPKEGFFSRGFAPASFTGGCERAPGTHPGRSHVYKRQKKHVALPTVAQIWFKWNFTLCSCAENLDKLFQLFHPFVKKISFLRVTAIDLFYWKEHIWILSKRSWHKEWSKYPHMRFTPRYCAFGILISWTEFCIGRN